MKYLLLIIFFPVICCDNGKRIGEKQQPIVLSDTIYIDDTTVLIVEGDYTWVRAYKMRNPKDTTTKK